jgi:hypothetical protein
MHNVNITDNDANWLKWGNLVLSWITDPGARPGDVAGLKAAMATAGVAGSVEGPDTRSVNIVDYSDAGPIVIPLPTLTMVQFDKTLLDAIAAKPSGQRQYPLPTFYAAIFGGAQKVDFTKAMLHDMALRRLGEYVINECM